MNTDSQMASTRQEPDDAAAQLQTDIHQRGPAVVIQARGELDAYTLPTWQQVISEVAARAGAPRSVIVDITRVDFIAYGALHTLADQRDACRAQGINLMVVSRASTVDRILTATGLDVHLAVHTSTEAALKAGASEGATK